MLIEGRHHQILASSGRKLRLTRYRI